MITNDNVRDTLNGSTGPNDMQTELATMKQTHQKRALYLGAVELHPALAHLTDDEVDRLGQLYDYGIEGSDAIKAMFGIETPLYLKDMVPAIVFRETCQFCPNVHLTEQRPSRLPAPKRKGVPPANRAYDPSCPECGHRVTGLCDCLPCRTARAEAAATASKAAKAIALAVYAKRQAAIERHCHTFIPESIPGNDAALCLLALVRHSVSDDLETAGPYDARKVPLASMIEIRRLVEGLYSQGWLGISSASSHDGFTFDAGNTSCEPTNAAKLTWNFLPGNQKKRALLAALPAMIKDRPGSAEWVENAWARIAIKQCQDHFAFLLDERGYTANVGEKVRLVFEDILRSFTPGEAFNLTWQAVRDTVDYIATKNLHRSHAANSFIGNVQRKADSALANGWTIKTGRRSAPLSTLDTTFFDLFTEAGASPLDVRVPIAGLDRHAMRAAA